MFATDGDPPRIWVIPPNTLQTSYRRQTDTVAPNGATYSGFLDFKLFLPTQCANSATGYVCTGTPIAEVTGTTAGTRITVD